MISGRAVRAEPKVSTTHGAQVGHLDGIITDRHVGSDFRQIFAAGRGRDRTCSNVVFAYVVCREITRICQASLNGGRKFLTPRWLQEKIVLEQPARIWKHWRKLAA